MTDRRFRVPAGTLVQIVDGLPGTPEVRFTVKITQKHCIFDPNDMPLGEDTLDYTFVREGKLSIRNCYTFRIPGANMVIRVPSNSVERFVGHTENAY